LTLQGLIAPGPSPRSGLPFATYAFTHGSCVLSDASCSSATCEDGNATLLAQRWGLTLDTNAWFVPALAVGARATVAISARPGDKLYYVARVATSLDDLLAIHAPGVTSTFGVDLFTGSTPKSPLVYTISGFDVNSTSSSNGNGTSCSPVCPVPAAGSCFVAWGNGTTAGSLPSQPPGSVCGDSLCVTGESCTSCPGDCGVCIPVGCGNGVCSSDETCTTCPADCGACSTCGAGGCTSDESCFTCPTDCGACPVTCGDGSCNGSETCATCESDCGVCGVSCGDGICSVNETCLGCAADCGACGSVCGDSLCTGPEQCSGSQ
jgi:hypothetical protein